MPLRGILAASSASTCRLVINVNTNSFIMPVKLIGKKVNYTGKTLWEIVGNLKKFGVGRLVFKSHFLNYAEPSYYKIIKVQPVEAPKDKYQDRRVIVWAEHVFRGKKYPELVKMHDRTFKPKFQLVPRSEEHKFLNCELKDRVKEISLYREWPPLFKIYLEREAARAEQKEIPKLRTVLSQGPNVIAVPVEEKPLVKDTPPHLYTEHSVKELIQKLAELKAQVETVAT